MANDRYINPVFLDNPLRSVFSPKEKVISRFREYLKENYTVVDLGCGPGFFTVMLSKIVKNGLVYAIDPDERAIRRLKEKIQKLSLRNVIPIVAPAQKLDFINSNSVDFVFSNLVLCCMVDHEGAIREIERILKKDSGKCYISVTKGYLIKDKRDVSKEEWKKILNRFKVIKEGESIMERWAVVEL
ncbi:methyltransferase domain-containing protein [Acidianus sulfidivorans JP7]|uniref:Class I SAM-dependent methyltransferase n=1 Tax=Acidianus sulfidivorans JP7 TaxID=619593 RepID=A0A2U9ILY5_9CREN|nr:class I SAM-dependent methyltransferase [Acidianus sulfidivorans]AWR96924.1 methyltransferase domain-containing protein [Acidianus sulfidivorans JP7]